MHELELLAPGGSLEGLKACVNAGADAIYMGGQRFGARAYAQNPDENGLLEAIEYCHLHGRRLYLTVNTLLRERELETQLYQDLAELYEHGLDAVLVQDLGVLSFIRSEFPNLPIHASTQMSVSSVDGARMLYELGCERIVPARELSLSEIRQIADAVPMEIECFVHGALCYSYSGQCLMSSMIGGRSGNRGRCAQPCRQAYTLLDREQKVSGKNGDYLLSLKDTCTIDILPQMIEAGICSFKIEGRMKRPEYAAGVTQIYRKYLDRYLGKKTDVNIESDKQFLMDLYNRGGFSQGYYSGKKGPSMMTMDRPNHAGTKAAKVKSIGKEILLTAQEDLYAGDVLEIDDKVGAQSTGLTLKEDIRNKKIFGVKTGVRLKEGQILRRTRCEKQLSEIRNDWMNGEKQEKIKGNFMMKEGEPIILEVELTGDCRTTVRRGQPGKDLYAETVKPVDGEEEGIRISVSGMSAQKAQKSEVTEESLRRQLMKTGGTAFVFDELTIDKEPNLFIPMSAVNELRREALATLKEAVLQNAKRYDAAAGLSCSSCDGSSAQANVSRSNPDLKRDAGTDAAQMILTASAETPEQMEVLTETAGIDIVYPDACMFLNREIEHPGSGRELFIRQVKVLHERGKKCMLMMPQVWRSDVISRFEDCFDEKTLHAADGYLLKNQQQLIYFRDRSIKGRDLIADDCIYTWNNRARDLIRSYGVIRDTLPDELNQQQLKERGCSGSEICIYGRTILMTTAQCLWKNTTGCTKHADLRILRDRKKAEFPVRSKCGICSNVIYNSLPLNLLESAQDIVRLGCSAYRLSFTTESKAETRTVAETAVMTFSGQCERRRNEAGGTEGTAVSINSGTRGHFKRGVE